MYSRSCYLFAICVFIWVTFVDLRVHVCVNFGFVDLYVCLVLDWCIHVGVGLGFVYTC